MILLIAKNTVKEDRKADFLRVAALLAEESRKEAGCCSYELVQDTAEETVYYFVEKYQDEAALEAHRNSAYFQKYVPELGALRTKSSEVSKCVQIDV